MKTLLATKTYLPSKPEGVVSRPRLLTILDTGLSSHARLALVSALAGSGKSTLLADWAARLTRRVAWLSLDSDDNDLYRFWAYVLYAIQSQFPQSCDSLLQNLSSAPPPAMEDFLPSLINTLAQLTSSPSSPLVVILDDYHTIEKQAIHDSMAFFLDHLPPHVQQVIATRTDPPLPLHRWRGRGQLVELRSADLRFTADEAEKFLNDVMGLHLQAEQVLQLGTRTEGWAVGLHLAALSLRGREDASSFIQRFSGSQHFVLEYLTNEVIAQQPPHVQEFLVQTSILEKMCADLCDAVRDPAPEGTECVDSSSVLDYLEHANLFLISLDDERQWYRYHHLFAELLKMRLAQEGEDRIHTLHQRAAEWFTAKGAIDEAVHHALAAANTTFAGDLVIRNWLRAGFAGQVRTALKWVEMLPKEMVRTHPLLSAANAYLLYLGGLKEAAEEHVDDVYRALAAWEAKGYVPDDGYDYSALPVEMAVLRANLATRKGQFQKGMEAAQEALRIAPHKAQVRGIAWNALSHAYRELGNIADAIPSYQESIHWNLESGNIIAVALATRYLSRLFQIQGDLKQAEDVVHSILEHAERANQSKMPAYGMLYVVLGEISYERNELEEARHWLEHGLEQGKMGGSLELLVSSSTLDARLRRVKGDLSGAIAAVDETYRSIHRMNEPVTEKEVRTWQARLQAEAGNSPFASEWADSVAVQAEPSPGLTHGIELFGLVRVLLALERTAEAQGLAAQLVKTARATNSLGWESEALMLQAEAHWMQSCPGRALDLLSQALSMAVPRGFARVFLDEGPCMAAMLQSFITRVQDPSLEGALRLLEQFPRQDAVSGSPVVSTGRVNSTPLSDREIEVVALMATGLSNSKIANRLVVSLATVKTHVSHIYDKLDVQNRAEAVARAKEKGLI